MKFKGKITCTIDANHPDRKYVSDWTPEMVLEFWDIYDFSPDFWDTHNPEKMIGYIKTDLLLVAGGGYNWDHVHNVNFEIKEVI